MDAASAAYIIHQSLFFHIDNNSTTPVLTLSLNTDSIHRWGVIARSTAKRKRKKEQHVSQRQVLNMGTHAGVQQVSTSLTANHIPLCGTFKEKQLYKKNRTEIVKGRLINLTAMCFIDKLSSLVRDYKKPQINKQPCSRHGAICWTTPAELNSTHSIFNPEF